MGFLRQECSKFRKENIGGLGEHISIHKPPTREIRAVLGDESPVNNASIALSIEFPMSRVFNETNVQQIGRVDRPVPFEGRRLILGADAQALAWATVVRDFPQLERDYSPVYDELKLARGREPLKAAVFKVPHHGSNRGMNFELVKDRIDPKYSLISSTSGTTGHRFPHEAQLESLREALQSTAKAARKSDHALGIHYTAARWTDAQRTDVTLGSIAIRLGPGNSGASELWRLRDDLGGQLDHQSLTTALRYDGPNR